MKALYESILSEAQLTESIFSASSAASAKKVAAKALKEQSVQKITELVNSGAVAIYNASGKMMPSDAVAKKGAIADNILYVPDMGKRTTSITLNLDKISKIIPDVDAISLCGRYGAKGPMAGTADSYGIRLYCGDGGYDGKGKINKVINVYPTDYINLKGDFLNAKYGSKIPVFKNMDLSEAMDTSRYNNISFENIFAENIILPKIIDKLYFSNNYDPIYDIRLGKNIIGSANAINIVYEVQNKDILSLYKLLFNVNIQEKDLDDFDAFIKYTRTLHVRHDLYKYIGMDKIKFHDIWIRIVSRSGKNTFFISIDNDNGNPYIAQCTLGL